MKIMEMSVAERPREKMMEKGPSALSNGELLAVLIGSGTRSESALDLGRRLVAEAGGTLNGLFGLSADRLTATKGIGKKKAAALLACIELGRRYFAESPDRSKTVKSSEEAFNLVYPRMKGLDHEECIALFLSSSNMVIGLETICVGVSDSTMVDVRRIVKIAVEKGARSVILFHNHPSGNPAPSKADIRKTEELHNACRVLSVALLDHIIIGDNKYYSFSDGKTK